MHKEAHMSEIEAEKFRMEEEYRLRYENAETSAPSDSKSDYQRNPYKNKCIGVAQTEETIEELIGKHPELMTKQTVAYYSPRPFRDVVSFHIRADSSLGKKDSRVDMDAYPRNRVLPRRSTSSKRDALMQVGPSLVPRMSVSPVRLRNERFSSKSSSKSPLRNSLSVQTLKPMKIKR